MIKENIKAFISSLWKLKYKLTSEKLLIGNSIELDSNCLFEGHNKIYSNSKLRNVSIGRGSYIGPECHLIDTSIGRFCSIADDVKIIIGNHPSSTFVSSHPAFYSTKKQAGFSFVEENFFEERTYISNSKSVIIGNDVWIGSGVRILEGVTIGDGAIIGTQSLVTKDVPPFSISVGTPAKHLKYRFNDEQINELNKLQWWNEDITYLKNNVLMFSNIERFLHEHKK